MIVESDSFHKFLQKVSMELSLQVVSAFKFLLSPATGNGTEIIPRVSVWLTPLIEDVRLKQHVSVSILSALLTFPGPDGSDVPEINRL